MPGLSSWSHYYCCCLVPQSCPTLCDTIDCSLLGSSVRGIFQARILEWIAISFSRGCFQPRDRTHLSCLAGRFFTPEPPGKLPIIALCYFFFFSFDLKVFKNHFMLKLKKEAHVEGKETQSRWRRHLHKLLQMHLRGCGYSTPSSDNLRKEFAICKVTVRGEEGTCVCNQAYVFLLSRCWVVVSGDRCTTLTSLTPGTPYQAREELAVAVMCQHRYSLQEINSPSQESLFCS